MLNVWCGSYRYVYPEAVSPIPTEIGYNEPSLERASSVEIPYDTHDANGYVGDGYTDANINGGSVATSPTPYSMDGYNENGYNGYNGNDISNNGNGGTCNENGSTINGYNGNGYNGSENGAAQFVRRRLLPAIPRGETRAFNFALF